MTDNSAIKVSVVITTYNRLSGLRRCLESLAGQTFPSHEYEVVVVADGCSDGTANFLETYVAPHPFQWVAQANAGQATAQNAGVALAKGTIVVFMDDDCVCEARLVSDHVEAHRRNEKSVVIGPVLLHRDTPRGAIQRLKEESEDCEFARLSAGGIRRSDMMLCANSSIAREAALACPFDAAYRRMHDVEAGLRLWDRGYRPVFAPEAIAYEFFVKPVAGVLSDARYQGQYEVFLAEKHPEFKPLASLARINEGNPVKRWFRAQLARHAGASGFLLRILYGSLESMRAAPRAASLAARVLSARIGLEHLRGAVEKAGSWEELVRRFGKRTPVISYHNVGRPRDEEYPGLTTPVAEFEAQIRLLRAMGYTAIVPEDWLRWRDRGGSLPERPVMLVFDDAYDEAAENAFPILERYGFKAACMVVTSCIGTTNRWDEAAGRPSFRLMNVEKIQEWSRRGIEFGGHTSGHSELTLVSDEMVEDEIARCKADLTGILGKPPASFAYPFGSFSKGAEAAVRRHFQLGFTVWPGRLHLATNPFLAPRIAFLPGESKLGMWCRLKLGRNPFEFLRNRWKKKTGSYEVDQAAPEIAARDAK